MYSVVMLEVDFYSEHTKQSLSATTHLLSVIHAKSRCMVTAQYIEGSGRASNFS